MILAEQWFDGAMILTAELNDAFLEPSSSVWRVSKGSILREDTICLTVSIRNMFDLTIKEYTFPMLCDDKLRKSLDFDKYVYRVESTKRKNGKFILEFNEIGVKDTLARAMIGLDAATKKIQLPAKRKQTIDAYVELGLDYPYAEAIVNGAEADEIMTLWESDWRKQYESDDFLIAAVLSGQLSANDAEYLNGIRSDHDDLVQACLKQEVTIEWTKALMDAGFNSYPEAVSGILKGTDPKVTARLLKLDINEQLLPPNIGRRRKNNATDSTSKQSVSEFNYCPVCSGNNPQQQELCIHCGHRF